MSLKIEYEIKDDKIIIKPIGEIDIYSSPELKDTALELLQKKNSDIVVDGKNLEYIDSTGLGVLMAIYKKLQEKDLNLELINLKANIYKLFDITGLNKVFTIKEL